MRKRSIREVFYLNDFEHKFLMEMVRKSGLSKTSYLRLRIKGYMPKEAPPVEYFDLIQQLRIIGNNINQIARVANSGGLSDGTLLRREVENLVALETIIRQAFMPEKEE